jgi:hypothetical protein
MCLRGVSPSMPQGNSQEAMTMQLVTHDLYGEFVDDPAEMHRLRYRVFKERLGWDVQVSGGMKIDEYDALHPAYLAQRAPMIVAGMRPPVAVRRTQHAARYFPSAFGRAIRSSEPEDLGE